MIPSQKPDGNLNVYESQEQKDTQNELSNASEVTQSASVALVQPAGICSLEVQNVPTTISQKPKREAKGKVTKADPCLKKILRAFRKDIKDKFVALYGKKYNHWIPQT